jgi:hypothetical protein
MSTVIQFPGDADDRPLTERVSQEVRALMGRHQVSQGRLAAWLGVNQTAVSARLRGATEWKVKEIERVAEGFAVHPASLMGGYAENPHPDGPDGGIPVLKYAIRDSNPEPAGLMDDCMHRPILDLGLAA